MAQPTWIAPDAAAHRQVERRADFGAGAQLGELRRQCRGVAVGPHHDGAFAAQVVEIDPGRALRQAVDQHLRLVRRIMRQIAAVPHRADDVAQRLCRSRRGSVASARRRARRRGKTPRGNGGRTAAAPNNWRRRQWQRPQTPRPRPRPCGRAASRSSTAVSAHHQPQPDKKPQRITPHREGAAAAHGDERDHGDAGPEREQCHDAAVEGVGEPRLCPLRASVADNTAPPR